VFYALAAVGAVRFNSYRYYLTSCGKQGRETLLVLVTWNDELMCSFSLYVYALFLIANPPGV
jgi:hypothetical protein